MALPIGESRSSCASCPEAVAVDVSSTDQTLNPPSRWIYVGGTGNLKVDMEYTGTVTLEAIPVGTLLPLRAKKIYNSGTTATKMIALW